MIILCFYLPFLTNLLLLYHLPMSPGYLINSFRCLFQSGYRNFSYRNFSYRIIFLSIHFFILGSSAQAQFIRIPLPSKEQRLNFSGTDLDGNLWSSSNQLGKAVVLNFWATWCAPCLIELPTLQTLAQISDPDLVSVISVNVRQLKPQVQRFVSVTALELPIILDSKGEIAKSFNIRIYPTTILIDSQGLAKWKIEGDVDWTSQQANSWIQALNNPKFRR